MYHFRQLAGIHKDLERISKLRTNLDGGRVLPRRWLGRLRRDLEAESIAASTAMEGVAVTVEEVRRILAGDRPATVTESNARLVEGYRDAMSYVLRRADDRTFIWQPELILGIHDRIMAGAFAQEAGRFRTRSAHLALAGTGALIYTPPPPEQVPQLVERLTSFVQQHQSKIAAPVLAALVHVQIAGIHPFMDGNGRTARVLASLVMHRGGYTRPEFTSLEEWWGSHRSDYYAAFRCLGDRWKPNVDATPFIAAHIRAQRQQIDALSLRQEVERQIWTILQDIATEDLRGPPRLADALYDAFFGRSITNRYYRELADVSMATATNDLAKLGASGLLVARGGGRSTDYLAADALIDRVAVIAGSFTREPATGESSEQRRAAVVRALAARAARSR